jgi:hypothetical protein
MHINNVSIYLGGRTAENINYEKNFFVHKFIRATWVYSKMICQSFGYDLAAPETADEMSKLRDYLSEIKSTLTEHVYFDGMTEADGTRTKWYFSSGKKIPYELPWAPGEPTGLGQYNEACVAFSKGRQFAVNDYPCDRDHFQFVCQQTTSYGL